MKPAHLGVPFWVGFALLLAASAWLRAPGFTQGGFANHDVGGILYNGMLLAAGKLPYVDSVEFKAPGTFYAAWWFGGGGRDIAAFQVWANLTALASLALVALAAAWLWGRTAGLVAGAIYGAHDLVLDTMDANYVTWAQLPHVAAVLVGLIGATRSRYRPLFFVAAGALAGASVLCKRPAGVALLTVYVTAALSVSNGAQDASAAEP